MNKEREQARAQLSKLEDKAKELTRKTTTTNQESQRFMATIDE